LRLTINIGLPVFRQLIHSVTMPNVSNAAIYISIRYINNSNIVPLSTIIAGFTVKVIDACGL